MFYTFYQNNSGGSFHESHGICNHVIVEADNANDANNRAENIGLYFDGCNKGFDCSCCGDRWYPAWREEGTQKPMIYSLVVESGTEDTLNMIDWCDYVAWIHYKDGRVEGFKFIDGVLENVVDGEPKKELNP